MRWAVAKKRTDKPKSKRSVKKSQEISDTLIPEIIEPNAAPKNEAGLVISDPLTRYMSEIRRYPLLSKEEEYALAVRLKEHGDREAAQKLVTANLRFVVKIAAEYSKFGAKLIDLVQEGNVGLMHAVREFNPYKGVRLITYAVWWIRGQIQEYLMRHYSMVRIGTTAQQRKLFYELQKERDKLERMGFEAGIAQLSGRLGIPEEEIKEVGERVLNRDISLSLPVGDESRGQELIDLQADANEVLADEELANKEQLELLKTNIEKIKPELSERENYILENRLLSDEPMTLQEIGDKYKITREAARQMETRLIQKIRKNMQA
jgi:RNA polymerase sigma-32 factor